MPTIQQIVMDSFTEPVFDPATISNMMFWYRGDGLTGANGSEITTWPDRSGHAFDLSALGGVGNRPIVQTNALNGFKALKNTGLSGLQVLNAGTVPSASNTYSFYCVLRFDQTGTTDFFGWEDGSGKGMRTGLDAAASALYHYVIPNVGDFQSTTTLNITGNWNRISVVANAGSYTIKINGTTVSWSGSAPSGGINGATGGINVGAGVTNARALVGQIEDLIGYNKALSGTEVGNLDSYVIRRYGIS
jgi:hypothetical protein